MKLTIGTAVAALMISACDPRPDAIRYGEDKCAHCLMTIVDPRFGCEMVTEKGKIYKFDAVECMVSYLNKPDNNPVPAAHLLTNTHDKPEQLTDVLDCVFLISLELPSPMGMYINPFHSEVKAIETQKRHGGTIYSWDELSDVIQPF